jgi:hypothetical protein
VRVDICGMMSVRENRNTRRKLALMSSTINPTWIALGLNSDLHDEKPMTRNLSYRTVIGACNWILLVFEMNKCRTKFVTVHTLYNSV